MRSVRFSKLILASSLFFGASHVANSGSGTFDVGFTTIADIQITQISALNFGSQVFIASGGVCTMNADTPANTTVNQGVASAISASNYGNVSGTGCVTGTGTGTPGVYEVTGLAGQAVNITIASITSGTNFNFNPNSGCIVTHDGAANGDVCNTFSPDTATSATLATSSDTGTSGTPIAGRLRFAVGGTITIGSTDLTPNTAYTHQFTVTAVY